MLISSLRSLYFLRARSAAITSVASNAFTCVCSRACARDRKSMELEGGRGREREREGERGRESVTERLTQ